MGDGGEWEDYWGSWSLKRAIIEFFRKLYFARIFAHIVKRNCKRGPVLEAGCGSGAILKFLPKNIIRIGCDNSIQALRSARENCDYVVRCDIANLPFKENSLEIIFNQGVMEHFNEEEFDVIVEGFKKASQKVLFIVPSSTSVFRLYNPFKDVGGNFISRKELYYRMGKHFKNVRAFHITSSFLISVAAFGEN